jgi:hypothetical protein
MDEDIVDRLRVLNFMGPWKEAADEIENLREALELVVVYWDEWMGKDGDPLALSLGEVVAAAREALKEKE